MGFRAGVRLAPAGRPGALAGLGDPAADRCRRADGGPLLGRVQRHDDHLDGRATRYKGTASGFGYVFVKFGVFVTMFLFPIMLATFGTAASTAIVSVISLAGFLAARYVLPEVYGYVESDGAVVEQPITPR